MSFSEYRLQSTVVCSIQLSSLSAFSVPDESLESPTGLKKTTQFVDTTLDLFDQSMRQG